MFIELTPSDIYAILENSNCVEDYQHLADYLNEIGEHGYDKLIKMYVELFI